MEPKITQGGESRMSREVIRKVISTPDLLDFRVHGEEAPGSSDFLKSREKPCSFLKFLPLAVGSNK